MGTNSYGIFLSVSLLFLCIGEFLASEEREATEKRHHYHLDEHYSHAIQASSLLPSAVCSSSATKTKSSLQIVHKYGPCSVLNQDTTTKSPDHADILGRDHARVDAINAKLSNVKQSHSAVLPARDGSTLGSGNYIVTVGLGTPKKDLSLEFDTGSDLTWTQCEPCATSCYSQKEPIFNPSLSTSYSNVSCSSAICSSLSSAKGDSRSCSSSTCVYGIQYGDLSFSIGFLAKERLTLTKSDVFSGFLFGCGENNQGIFLGSAGLLGLGRGKLSVPSQTASVYKKIFSYCLPSSASSTGHLTFGSAAVSRSVKFTPLSTTRHGTSLYGLDMVAISVYGQKLEVPLSVYSTAGAIIDSGTIITRLPPKAYAALRSAFRAKMSRYKKAPAFSILDTCYDLSGYKTIFIPKIVFFFSGGVEVNIDWTGIVYARKITQVCLAFAGNRNDINVAIFGNMQQRTLDVVYDVPAGRIGFAPGGCT